MKIQILSVNGSILFEGDFPSISETLVYAVRSCANLSCANLSCADLSGADLSGANLSGANLSGVNLSYANLSYANLFYANLFCACVKWAQLAFMEHGECGRMLVAIQIKEEDPVKFYCGCFTGSLEELRTYILSGDSRLKKTRTLALDTILILLEAKND